MHFWAPGFNPLQGGVGIPPAQPQLMERSICCPVQPRPLGVFFSLPWAAAVIPGGWISPSKRAKLQNKREQSQGEIPVCSCLPAELCSDPASQGGEADGEAGRGRSCSLWLEDGAAGQPGINPSFPEPLLQLFSLLCIPFVQRDRPKNCQGHHELPGSQGCLSWSSCREERRIRSNIPIGSALALAAPRKTAQK